MTKTQQTSHEIILAAITKFKNEKGYATTIRELAALTNYSMSSVQYVLNVLERDRVITRDRRVSRSIVIVG